MINELRGLEVNVQEDVWVKATFVEEFTQEEIHHKDGSYSGAYTYLKYSDNGSGWYRFYERDKTRKILSNYGKED